jgi:ERCC4-related helicase
MNHTELLTAFEERGCLPHQAEFAAGFFAPGSIKKHLLVSAPGFGKGFVAGAIVNHALSSGQARRVLVLSPSALVAQWFHTIQRGQPSVPPLIVDRRRLRELEDSQPVGEDFWPQNAVVIMSVDFAKRDDVAINLTRTPWDLLVVDEVQLATTQNLRGRVITELVSRWPMIRVLLLRVGGILAGAEIGASFDLFHDAAVTEWSRESVRDRQGKPLLPEVQIEWINHHRRPDEIAVLNRLQHALRSITTASDLRSRFTAIILLQSASSCLFALEQRLCRLRQRRNELSHGTTTEPDAELDSAEAEADELLAAPQDVQARVQLEAAEVATPLLEMLEKVTTDSKCEALFQTLHSLGVRDGAERRVCVFTRFVDTATYLDSALRDRYSQVRVVTGSAEFAERERIIEDFANNGGVLIATESVEEGIPEVSAVIFYDLPLSAARLERRIGQFVRVGRHGPIRVFAFVDQSGVLRIERLQKSVAEMKERLGKVDIEKALFSTEES